MNSRTIFRPGLLLCLLAIPALQASTISLPIASSVAMINTTDNATTYCSLNGSPVNCSYGGATASAQITNGGSAQAAIGTSTNLAASSSTGYGIAVTGSGANSVPIIINGVSATHDNGSSSFGIAFIAVIDSNVVNSSVVSQYFGSSFSCAELLASAPSLACTSPGAYNFHASLIPGDLYFVELTAGAAGGGNASAMIDPQIMIDPSFAQAIDFTLVASPGVFSSVPPTSNMPEPNFFGLFGLAFTAIALRTVVKARRLTA